MCVLTWISIIFSCWTRTLHLLAKHLDEAGIPYLRIDGGCTVPQRQAKLDQFAKDDEKRVLIMTTGTGGFGYVCCRGCSPRGSSICDIDKLPG